MRSIREPFLVARPAGARVRTRLRLSVADQTVIWAIGEYLGSLAGADLAWRCRLGPAPDQRTARKRTLTSRSSSRWAGSITRTSGDQWQREMANLADHRIALRRASRTIRSRLAVPIGQRQGRVRGYGSQAERFAKHGRLQRLQAELAEVEDRLAHSRVAICRGGRRLAKQRYALKEANLTEGSGGLAGTPSGCSSPPTGTQSIGLATGPSRCIRRSNGWSYGCRLRWRIWPTGRAAVIGWRAR